VFLIDPPTKASIKALMMILLLKAIIKTIRELKQIVSQEYRLVEVGIREAWKFSELAASRGHKITKI
jgi:hypothetical protein